MSSKTDNLAQALKQGSGRAAPEREEPAAREPVRVLSPEGQGRPSSRAGKKNIGAWIDPAYERSLLMVRAATGKKSHQLLAEALNDLFAKYNVPQIRED